MYLLYSILLFIGIALLSPRFLLDAVRHGKYTAGFRERLGSIPAINRDGQKSVIWLHCVSVGETQAARAVVRELLARFPAHTLVVSTTTLTGQRVARDVFGSVAAAIFYFPFDWAWTVRRALSRTRPSLVLVMETELWPRFLRECRRQSVPVALINGRISERSLRNYQILSRFMRAVVNDLSIAVMQTEADAARIRQLGLAQNRIVFSGNVKFDLDDGTIEEKSCEELCARFDLANKHRPLIVAASTHAPEERILLKAFAQLSSALKAFAPPRLLLAPRHPERFAEVASLIAASGFSWARRTAPVSEEDVDRDVILLDSIGELRAVYGEASTVFVGGSLIARGGHNVIEPAAAGKCIVTGAHTSNFANVVRAFLDAEAIVQLPPSAEERETVSIVAKTFEDLLLDEGRRQTLGENARNVILQNCGATRRTVELLTPFLDAPSPRPVSLS